MKKFLLLLIMQTLMSAAAAESYKAKVIAVIDGDTLLVLRAATRVKIRLADIDAPETAHAGHGGSPQGQPFGLEARQALAEMVLHKQLLIESKAEDKYGRTVALVFLDGRNINQEMVKRGMAWAYSYSHRSHAFTVLQSEAQQARRGLWRQQKPVPPWQWRKAHPLIIGGVANRQNTAPARTRNDIFLEADCGSKNHCSQMSSCDEAFYYYIRCGVKALDKEEDGMPCKQLCERH